MSSDNFKDLTPDKDYVYVDCTGESIVLPPDTEDVILVVEGDSSISGTVNVELEHSHDNVNFTTAKNKPVGAGAQASFSLSALSQVSEGDSITVNLATAGVSEGLLVPFTITGIQASDLVSNSLTGSIEIDASGNGSVVLQPTQDLVTESETITFTIGSSGNPLGTLDITVLDTAYSITPAASSMDEDASLLFNVGTTNVSDGATLYYTINHGTTATADFVAESGSFTITSNAGSFSIQTIADLATEGSETFTVQIRSGSISGTILATSSTITINDTSFPGFTNAKYIGANVNSSGIGLGAYQGAMDHADFGTFGTGGSQEWTVSFWAKVNSASDLAQVATAVRQFSQTSSSGGNYVSLDYNLTEDQFRIGGTNTSSHWLAVNVPGGTNAWRHYAITFSQGANYQRKNVEVFIDGQSVTTLSSVYYSFWFGALFVNDRTIGVLGRFNSSNVAISWANRNTTPTSYDIDIGVDEVSIWNTALSSSTINTYYNSGTPTDLDSESNLVRWFRMGDSSGDTGTSIEDSQDTNDTLTGSVDYTQTLSNSDSIKTP